MKRVKGDAESKARHLEGLRRFASSQRDTADEVSAQWGVDDPLHPWHLGLFRDWLDFVDQVARPLVDADGDEDAVQAAMALYRKACPHYICTALVMAANRANGGNQ